MEESRLEKFWNRVWEVIWSTAFWVFVLALMFVGFAVILSAIAGR